MRTEKEVRDWLDDLDTYVVASPEQGVGIQATKGVLRWVLGEDVEGAGLGKSSFVVIYLDGARYDMMMPFDKDLKDLDEEQILIIGGVFANALIQLLKQKKAEDVDPT